MFADVELKGLEVDVAVKRGEMDCLRKKEGNEDFRSAGIAGSLVDGGAVGSCDVRISRDSSVV